MTRIVRTPYRYKRPPGKRRPVALEVPAWSRRPIRRGPARASLRPRRMRIRHKPSKILPPGLLPETPEEANRRADAADALWRELVRRAAEKP